MAANTGQVTRAMADRPFNVFTSLPLRALDRLSLQKKLWDIGRIESATAAAAEAP